MKKPKVEYLLKKKQNKQEKKSTKTKTKQKKKQTKTHKQQKPKQTQNSTKPSPHYCYQANGSNFQGTAIYKNLPNYVGQLLNCS